jgi:hypothetical protein
MRQRIDGNAPRGEIGDAAVRIEGRAFPPTAARAA